MIDTKLGSAAPSVEEWIAEIEQIAADSRLPGVWKSNVRWLIAELRARDEALREARKNAERYTYVRNSILYWTKRSELPTNLAKHVDEDAKYPTFEQIDAAIDAHMAELFDEPPSLARTEGGDVDGQ